MTRTKKQKPPPRAPTSRRIAEAAQNGDIAGMIEAFEGQRYYREVNWGEFSRQLRKAMEQAGEENPARLVDLLLGRMLALQGQLMFRCERYINAELDQIDEHDPDGEGEIPSHIAEEWLPRLSRIQREIKDTATVLSKTSHVLELAQARSIENEKIIPFETDDNERGKQHSGDGAAGSP